MIETIKELWKQLFTEEKFPNKGEKRAVGDKTVGDVYDVTYMPAPDDPGEMVVVFGKKEDV